MIPVVRLVLLPVDKNVITVTRMFFLMDKSMIAVSNQYLFYP